MVQQLFFIALLPPPALQAEVNAVKQIFAECYASRAAQKSPPHITLQAPFNWPIEEIPRLQACLEQFADTQTAVPITLDGFAAFPPRVIYINVLKTPELLHLQANLATCCLQNLGLHTKTPHRPFAPHMTVGFRDLTRQNFKAAWAEFQDQVFTAEFIATHLTLLMHQGHHWEVCAEFDLRSRSLSSS